MSITAFSARSLELNPISQTGNIGPGEYETQTSRKIKKTPIPFGSTTRRDLWNIESTPIGPGSYEPKTPSLKVKGVSNFSLESTRKYFDDNENTPSPADFSNQIQWGQKRKPTKTFRPKQIPIREIPTPKRPQTPGPGQYDTTRDPVTRGTNFSKSLSPQRPPVKTSENPGPGYYTVVGHTLSSRSYSIPNNPRKLWGDIPDNREMLPHTAWNPEIFPGRPFGSSTKRDLDWGLPTDNPGPADHVSINFLKGKSRGKRRGKKNISFERGIYTDIPQDNPGPGFYETNRPQVDRHHSDFAQSPKKELFHSSSTPGPGYYETEFRDEIYKKRKLQHPNTEFLGEKQRDCLTNPEPGPGPKFNTRTESRNGSKFSKTPRFTDDKYLSGKFNENPSPDSYNIDRSITTPGAYISKIPNRFDSKIESTLGPGSYEPKYDSMVKPSYNVKFDPQMIKKRKKP